MEYRQVYAKMLEFTHNRNRQTCDEIWVLQHLPVLTLGRKADTSHILNSQKIQLVQTDRGGQVTYHAPGQLIFYFLLDLNRLNLQIDELIFVLENLVINYLQNQNIKAYSRKDAPGVYLDLNSYKFKKQTGAWEAKIASLGLRIHKGYSYHGLSFNIDMDMSGFDYINPCGYAGMQMAQMQDLGDFKLEQIQSYMINSIDGIFGRKWQEIQKTQLIL